MRKLILFVVTFCAVLSAISQPFSRKDSLRGNLTTIRTCYDVTFYGWDRRNEHDREFKKNGIKYKMIFSFVLRKNKCFYFKHIFSKITFQKKHFKPKTPKKETGRKTSMQLIRCIAFFDILLLSPQLKKYTLFLSFLPFSFFLSF